MNSVNIIGTMTRGLELKYLPSGVAVGSFAIAVNQDYKKQDGTKVEKTSFFDVKVIGKQSEIINQYFSKGSRIGITGELEQETWQDNQGQNRSKVVIKLEQFSFIDKKGNHSQIPQSNMQELPIGARNSDMPEIDLDDSDSIPFNGG